MYKLRTILKEIRIIKNLWKDPKLVNKNIEKIKKVEEYPLLNLKLGKWDIDKGQRGVEYSWEEALNNKIITKPTINRSIEFFNLLGVKPEKVFIGYYLYDSPIKFQTHLPGENRYMKAYDKSINLKSTYILGFYKDEPIILVQRQTESEKAGRFYIYSKYTKSEYHFLMSNNIEKHIPSNQIVRSHNHSDYIRKKYKGNYISWNDWQKTFEKEHSTKENILKALKINA